MLAPYAQQTMVNALPIGAAIFTGSDHKISAVNPQMLAIWSKEPSVVGKDLLEALPEIRDQGFFELLTDVYTTGNEYHNPSGKAELVVDGKMQTKYFDFSFKPLKDASGVIYGIVNTAVDTTERELTYQQLQLVNNELSALNEEYQALNEELEASGEEIKSAYTQLDEAHNNLIVTEQKGRLLLEGAPVAVGVIDVDIFTIDSANDKLLELWSLDRQAVGKPISEVLPIVESTP